MISKLKRDAENFRLRTGKEWVNSETITNCAECDEKFTVLKRKHHCRQCGLVICKKCSPERILINNIKVRICQSCSDDVSVRGFPSNSISSNDYYIICCLCQQSTITIHNNNNNNNTINNTNNNNNSMIEGRINGQELIYWHSNCLKCEYCSTILKLNEAYTFPHLLNNKDNSKPHFYCEEHIPKNDHNNNNNNNYNYNNDVPPSPLSTPSSPNEKQKYINQLLQSSSIHDSTNNQNQNQQNINSLTITTTTTTTTTGVSPLTKIFEPLHFIYGKSPKTQYYLLHIPQENIDKIPTSTTQSTNIEDYRSVPLVVILHGGFWKSKYSISNSCLDNLPKFFMSSGIAVCIIEYRRVKAENEIDEGGWPETGEDILNALNHLHNECTKLNLETIQETHNSYHNSNKNLTRRALIDTNRIVLLGHSAGGQLALWSCCEPQLSKLPFKPLMCVGIAPVANMIEAFRLKLSDEGDAVENFMKMPFDSSTEESVKAYYSACPAKLLPLLIPTILVTGTSDTDVPSHLIEDFYWYAKRISGEILTKCVSYQNSKLNNKLENNNSSNNDNIINDDNITTTTTTTTTTNNNNNINNETNSIVSESKTLESRLESFISLNYQSILNSYQISPPALKLLKLAGSTHYDVMDSTSNAWNSIFEEIMLMSPQLGDIPDLNLQLYQNYLNEIELLATSSTNNITSTENENSDFLSNSVHNTSESNRVLSRSESDSTTPIRQSQSQSQNYLSSSPLPSSSIPINLSNGNGLAVRASDIIWISDNKNKYSDRPSGEILSDSSSDERNSNAHTLKTTNEETDTIGTDQQKQQQQSQSQPQQQPNNNNNNNNKKSNSNNDKQSQNQDSSPTSIPSELFSFPTPKNDRNSKKGFGFRFLNQDDES